MAFVCSYVEREGSNKTHVLHSLQLNILKVCHLYHDLFRSMFLRTTHKAYEILFQDVNNDVDSDGGNM